MGCCCSDEEEVANPLLKQLNDPTSSSQPGAPYASFSPGQPPSTTNFAIPGLTVKFQPVTLNSLLRDNGPINSLPNTFGLSTSVNSMDNCDALQQSRLDTILTNAGRDFIDILDENEDPTNEDLQDRFEYYRSMLQPKDGPQGSSPNSAITTLYKTTGIPDDAVTAHSQTQIDKNLEALALKGSQCISKMKVTSTEKIFIGFDDVQDFS